MIGEEVLLAVQLEDLEWLLGVVFSVSIRSGKSMLSVTSLLERMNCASPYQDADGLIDCNWKIGGRDTRTSICSVDYQPPISVPFRCH